MKNFIIKRALFVLFTGLFLTFSQTVKAQSALDGFDPNINGTIKTTVIQPDGKILVGGLFSAVGGQTRYGVARINMNGTLDTTFNSAFDGSILTGGGDIASIVLQADGKILVGGNFGTVGGQTRRGLARLNSDGTLDSFNANLEASARIYAVSVQADGKILVGGGTLSNSDGNIRVVRLNADGTRDNTFNVLSTNNVRAIKLQPAGKILIAGEGLLYNTGSPARVYVARFNSDGTTDLNFNPVNIRNLAGSSVQSLAVQPDGKILIGGSFYENNGSGNPRNFARLDTSGAFDTTFNPVVEINSPNFYAVTLQKDGKILIAGSIYAVNGTSRSNIARLNFDGTLDAAFNPNPNQSVESVTVQADNKILFGGSFSTINGTARSNFARVYDNGALDATLNPNVQNGSVWKTATQPDGKILIGGDFTQVSGQNRKNLARLNADGTIDSTFNANLTTNSNVIYAIAVQTDGKILIGGIFTINNAANTAQVFKNVARLNSDGTPDTTFLDAGANSASGVLSLAIQPNGKILVGGTFLSLGGRNYFVRLNADGTTDTAFNPNVLGFVQSIAQEPDGKILVGGGFLQVGGQTRNRIARLNADGSLDPNFDPNADFNVLTISRQPDGKILVGGQFANIGGTARRLARLNPSGTLDSTFNPIVTGSSVTIDDIKQQSDGKIIFGGNFQAVNAVMRSRLARLNPDGTLDPNFSDTSSSSDVYSIDLQSDGKILVGGAFDFIGGQLRNRIARLNNDAPAAQTLSVTKTTVTLTVGGAGPQLSRVVFEYSTDGTNYTLLGEATRSSSLTGKAKETDITLAPTATTFTLSGLNLPNAQNIFIRARAFDANGSETGGTTQNPVLLAPTASAVSISGRVITPQDLGLTNALVTLTGSQGHSQTILTGKFGSFMFREVAVGETYILTVSSKRHTYAPQIISPRENLTGIVIAAQ